MKVNCSIPGCQNPQKTKELCSKHYQSLPEHKLASHRYYKLNKAKVRERSKLRYEQNKAQILAKYKAECTSLHRRWIRHKAIAKSRDIENTITYDDFERVVSSPCYYCNNSQKTRGLDRVDNSKGYLLNNIVSCCWTCNSMKGSLSIEQWVGHIAQILATLKEKL